MTRDAQAALRRVMELYSRVTRFCLICNYVTKIIDPISSRCAKFRFKPLDQTSTMNRLVSIAALEQLDSTPEALEEIIRVACGDLRRAINILQSSKMIASEGRAISSQDIYEVASIVPPEIIQRFIYTCLQANSTFADAQQLCHDLISEGFAVNQFLLQLQQAVIPYPGLDDQAKANICLRFGEIDRDLADGADEYLQLLKAASTLLTAPRN